MLRDLRLPLFLLALAIVLAFIALLFSRLPIAPQFFVPPLSRAGMIRTGAAPIPPYAPEMQQKVAASHGFQVLVSYTDHGFEPQDITITKGDTVRFTNNSSGELWIAATGDAAHHLYPQMPNDCGSSHLDSCVPLAPQDFWEFTFTEPGEWHYTNNLDKNKNGIVVVHVQ